MFKMLECPNCYSNYNLEFNEDIVIMEPVICPFCGEDITEEEDLPPSFDDLEEEE